MADMLSRSPIIDEITREELLDFETLEFESDEYLDLVKHITENQEKLPDLKVQDGLVFKKTLSNHEMNEDFEWKLWLPSTLTHEIIEKAHQPLTAAHGGIEKTLDRVKRFFYWPRMTLQVRKIAIRAKNPIPATKT